MLYFAIKKCGNGSKVVALSQNRELPCHYICLQVRRMSQTKKSRTMRAVTRHGVDESVRHATQYIIAINTRLNSFPFKILNSFSFLLVEDPRILCPVARYKARVARLIVRRIIVRRIIVRRFGAGTRGLGVVPCEKNF